MPVRSGQLVKRPLVGEPLGLDLLNTRWVSRGRPHDLLTDLAGLAQWLTQAGLSGPSYPVTADALSAVRTARTAIHGHLENPGSEGARAALNEVLAWGHSHPSVTPEGIGTTTRVADPEQLAPWLAAVNYVELCARDRSRVRRCAHAGCTLHFFDTSPQANRRWCSMALCGNRAKAARHYARAKPAQPRF